MYVKFFSLSLLAATVMFSGCGDDKTACRVDVQKAMDEGRYDDAIADMNGSCRSAFTKSDLSMNLAAAYMGKSGYSVSDIVSMFINSDNENGDAFTSFLSSVNEKKRANSLVLLTRANSYYLKAIGKESDTDTNQLCSTYNLDTINDPRLTNVCLYIGFNDTIKSANTISYLTGDLNKTIDSIDNKSGETPDDMQASLDALKWVTDATYFPEAGTIISGPSVVTIADNSFANVHITYEKNGKSKVFYRLAKTTKRDPSNTTVVTDGYCDRDGNRSVCDGVEKDDGSIDMTKAIAASCYACPIVMDANNTLGVAQLLVDSLNDGSDAITAVSDDPDITNSVTDFKENITGSSNGTVTIQNMIDYLQQ